MGQTISEPSLQKDTNWCENENYQVGSSSMQGWRVNMEDSHTYFLELPGDLKAAYFAVFDGHGGTKVAQYAGNQLHRKIVQQVEYESGNYEEAITSAFLELDQDMSEDKDVCDELAGATGIALILRDRKIFCGNIGDSRAIASVCGVVEQLSFDHKPTLKKEHERIVAAGGWVESNRVNGNLALSRAFGDFVFKKNERKSAKEQIVTAFPDVVVRDVTQDHEFVVIACDGIWDVLTNQEVINFVRIRIAAGFELAIICEELMMRCLAPDCTNSGLGCDNMTVVILGFLQGTGNFDHLVGRCSQPSKAGVAADILCSQT